MRDVTPRTNNRAGHDHGCGDQPPDAAGSASTDMNKTTPPADNAPASKQ